MPRLPLLILALLLGGCASTHDQLLAQGYPPAFADGFEDGCGSGREAAGAISGGFRKDVPRYLADERYSSGWEDGFRQCQGLAQSEQRRRFEERGDEDEEDWQRSKTRALGQALSRP